MSPFATGDTLTNVLILVVGPSLFFLSLRAYIESRNTVLANRFAMLASSMGIIGIGFCGPYVGSPFTWALLFLDLYLCWNLLSALDKEIRRAKSL